MKKLVLSILIILCLLLTACGSESTSSEGDEIEIRLLTRMGGESEAVTIFQDIIQEFEEENPRVTIIDESQGEEGAYNNKLKTDLASGTLPNIFRIGGQADLVEYVENDLLMDVSPILDEDPDWGNGFVEAAVNFNKINDDEGIYGIPMESGLIGVFYNEELFQQAGIDKFPATWKEFLVAVEKLKEIDVIPLSLGAQATFMTGHLHNQLFYKWNGVEAARELGTGNLEWTDKDVIKTLEYVKELNDLGTFGEDAVGINEDIALNNILQGDAAMMITGPWSINQFINSDKTEFSDSIKVAKFPYFSEKPEYKDDDMQVISSYMVNGNLTDEEKEYTIKLLKKLTSSEAAERYAEEAEFLVPRTDIEIDESKVSELLLDTIELGSTSKDIGTDVTDFDLSASIKDKRRNITTGVLTGTPPEEAGKEIQDEKDKASN